MGRVLSQARAVAVVHPFPSLLNALLVAALVMVASGGLVHAVELGLAMFGLQASIGAVNDLFDEDVDARTKPAKPIPHGLIGRHATAGIAIAAGALGLAVSAAFGILVLALAAGMYGAGLAYDAFLKRTAWGWLAYAVAFPMLPLYAWLGAGAGLPPRPELLLPVAALAGPTLALANGIVDLERDRVAGVRGPAVVLGRDRTLAVLGVLQVLVFTTAWGSLLTGPSPGPAAVAVVTVATGLVVAGVGLSASQSPSRRERGWEAQAVAIALLGGGWLVAALGLT
jgi:4-hydroxybenzoate polyprenyltransferase